MRATHKHAGLTQCGFSINKVRSWRDRWGQASGLTVLHPPGLRLRHLPCSSLVLLTMDRYPGLWMGGRGAGERSRRPAWGAGSRQSCPPGNGAAAALCLASPAPGNQQINSPHSQHTCPPCTGAEDQRGRRPCHTAARLSPLIGCKRKLTWHQC